MFGLEMKWAPAGIANYERKGFDEDTRSRLKVELGKFGAKSLPDGFFTDLEHSVAAFQAGAEIAKSSRPAEVRRNLNAALKKANELDNCLRELDGNSTRLINLNLDSSVHLWQRDGLSRLIHALEQAMRRADKFPKGGRLPEYQRLNLAVDAGKALITHLGENPTSTENGLYAVVLEFVLEIATGKEAQKVTDLARRAVKVINATS